MKVIRNTPEQLILEHRPWFWSVMFAIAFLGLIVGWWVVVQNQNWHALPVLIIGTPLITLGLFVVERWQLILDRSQDRITIRRRTISNYHTQTYALPDLQCARLETVKETGEAAVHRVLLHVADPDNKEQPLSAVYQGGSDAAEMVSTITLWLGVKTSSPLDSPKVRA